ncbi:MAG: symmetrical bis(5'-nucleosyl)-tetraphosphatase [Gammaproteobacteria bacterium]|nr:MAG: symmetrical bis(5'-nucleosyl)-tetraphosphatase [Gammaproteobacteria bacterium]
MATYAIGDIQGCYDEFRHLLDNIHFNSTDRLWLVGDVINRGPRSLQTLRFIRNELADQAIMVLGNHEIYALAAFHKIVSHDEKNTFYEIFDAPDAEELLYWIRNRPLVHYDPSLRAIMTHAGIPPVWNLTDTLTYANEIAEQIRSEDYVELLTRIFGQFPTDWDANRKGWQHYRYLVDGLTRLRFCTPEGTLDVKTKGGLSSAPQGYYPWFQCPGRKPVDADIIFGHWSALRGIHLDGIYGIDTGCVWGGRLTALRLEDKVRFSVQGWVR